MMALIPTVSEPLFKLAKSFTHIEFSTHKRKVILSFFDYRDLSEGAQNIVNMNLNGLNTQIQNYIKLELKKRGLIIKNHLNVKTVNILQKLIQI